MKGLSAKVTAEGEEKTGVAAKDDIEGEAGERGDPEDRRTREEWGRSKGVARSREGESAYRSWPEDG
jgi:hypothetical protein